jgi:transcriptional regulator with XRE-family HTH domain
MSDAEDAVGRTLGALGEFIKTQRELANMSMRELAKVANISNPYLSQIERGLYKPSADVLKNLAAALRISAEAMYAQAGLLDEEPRAGENRDVEQAIKLDPLLTADQKETLIRIYQGFTARRPPE